MDHSIFASLSHTHYWYEVVISLLVLKVPAMESALYVFSFQMVFFDFVTTGWIFDYISLLCENSIKSIKVIPLSYSVTVKKGLSL